MSLTTMSNKLFKRLRNTRKSLPAHNRLRGRLRVE